ncbi:CLIP domain-containing serine protease HP8-like [Epargyreus clarus]|uniref:CLIP domain-containing serine protease HP8-like n=1 Tax=Epargyreus clarus TaxID=520877 RepID=UPI003C2F1211
MNYKCLECVCAILVLLVCAECLFIDDTCEAENETGVCRLLSECDYLINEIRRAGSPMPAYLRRKLQALSCGFDSDEPVVCCKTDVDTNSGSTGFFNTGSTQDFNTPPKTNSWQGNGAANTNRRPTNNFNPLNDNQNINNNNNNINVQTNRHPNIDILPKDCGVIESDRLFGGNRTKLFEMPWMVLVAYNSVRGTKLSCGGTLITEWYVLTAAHCVSFLGERLSLSGIILGEYDIRQDPDCERSDGDLICAPPIRTVQIDTVIPHPGYSPQNLFDDIALVRLAQPADFTQFSTKPICLPTSPELKAERLDGKQGVVAGWGVTEEGLQSPVLLKVELPIVTNVECQTAYNGQPHIYDKQLCAGGIRDKDSCGGDSGGPLMVTGRPESSGLRYVQRGIVSYGSKRCGVGGYPGVYTRVSTYMDWILDNIRR